MKTLAEELHDLELLALVAGDTFHAHPLAHGMNEDSWGVFDQTDHIRAACGKNDARLFAYALHRLGEESKLAEALLSAVRHWKEVAAGPRSDLAYRRGVAKAYGECAGELELLLKKFGGVK